MRAMVLAAMALVAVAGSTAIYLGVPLPRFSVGSSSAGHTLSASPTDEITYSFLNTTTGWALDSRRDINGNGDFWIFRTVDGAQHWQEQLRGKTSAQGISVLTFFDPVHGFAMIAAPFQLYRTTDGGTHWNLLRIPGRAVQSIQFTDPRNGWLLDAEGSAVRNTLYFTRDGGDTWEWRGYPPEDASGLAMRDQNLSWMAGTGGAQSHVYFSFDGGVSWQQVQLPSFARALGARCLNGITLLPTDGVIAAVDCGVYSSFDQGATWVSIPTPPPNSTSWARITYAAEFDWWTMTGGDLWKSTDAGQTWTLFSRQDDEWDYIPNAIDRKQAWATLVHLDPATGLWAVPPLLTGLALTSDGGLHWTQVNAPRP